MGGARWAARESHAGRWSGRGGGRGIHEGADGSCSRDQAWRWEDQTCRWGQPVAQGGRRGGVLSGNRMGRAWLTRGARIKGCREGDCPDSSWTARLADGKSQGLQVGNDPDLAWLIDGQG